MSPAVVGMFVAAASAPVVRIGVDLVQVDAIVTDKQGRQVSDLTAADFEIYENGKKQTITHCEYVKVGEPIAAPPAPEVPVSPAAAAPPVKHVPGAMALVVHDYGLSLENLDRVRTAVRRFVGAHADGATKIAVTRTGHDTQSLSQFTADPAVLATAVETLAAPPKDRMPPADIVAGEEILGPFPGGGDAEFRATWHRKLMLPNLDGLEAVVTLLAQMPGRRSIVLFSDRLSLENHDPDMRSSLDPWVMERMDRIRESANRASIVMYTVTATGVRTLATTASQGGRARNFVRAAADEERFTGLHVLPEATGGLWIKNTNDLTWALDKVAADQEGYYILGYAPDKAFFETKDGKAQFRKLKVKVKRSGVKVRSCSGLLGVADESSP